MTFARIPILCLIWLIFSAQFTFADTSKLDFKLDAAALEARGQLKELRFRKSKNVINLNDMLLIEDDAPGCGLPEGLADSSWVERLHKGIIIKKEFILDKPGAFSGYVVLKGRESENNDEPLHLSLNSIHFVRSATKIAHPSARQYYGRFRWDRWFYIELPVGALKIGLNELLLWSESEKVNWEILIAVEQEFKRGSVTRTTHPNRSAKSLDGGRTWNSDKLGWKNEVDGEYSIRMSIDRYVPEGIYTSPVIDIAEKPDSRGIKSLVAIRNCNAEWDIDSPEGTTVEISYRHGDSPVPSDDFWTEWKQHKANQLSHGWQDKRYFQFKTILRTENPLVTPSIKALSILTTLDIPEKISPAQYRIVSSGNGKVIRSSYEFVNEDFQNKELKKFRRRFKLDKVVKGAVSEFDMMMKLLRWSYEIPVQSTYSWNYNEIAVLKKEKGKIKLQKNYKGRRRDAMCLFSNQVLMGACISMGLTARHVNIHSEGVSGHEVMEVWSNEFNKWIYMDATRDYYPYDPETNIPLNVMETHNRLVPLVPRVETIHRPFRLEMKSDSLALKADIAYREGFNKYSIRDINQGPHLLLTHGHFRTPMRNDFMSREAPIPIRQGNTMWGWNGFLNYYDDKFPRRREYQQQTERPQDFYWTLNQSELTLSETEKSGMLRVDIDTETPCFDTFIIRTGNSKPIETTNTSFTWELQEGLNHIRVRVRNTAGVLGPESYISVVMNN